MNNSKIAGRKPIVLTFVGNYLPGYKAGGILRNIVNTIDHLCDEYDFWVVTRDRDLGDDRPYQDITINAWQRVGNAMVYYLSPESNNLRAIHRLIVATKHDILFLNSFFDPLTIKVLVNRKLNGAAFKPIIVAPYGEFAWASLGQKFPKKIVFIHAARLWGLYKNLTWRVSSEFEAADLMKVMRIKNDPIHIAGDFPIKNIPEVNSETVAEQTSGDKCLRIVFLSRISREKNLDYALKVLGKVRAKVLFDIYGPDENKSYWNECQELIKQLPGNIVVKYLGNANANQVLQIFSHYDLFLFPTGGEAYGNVIAESLMVGTPVLVSTETPWRNLQADRLGWDISLGHMDAFVDVIEKYSQVDESERSARRTVIRAKIQERLCDPAVLETNRQLFNNQLTG